ncbi:MAG: TetR/AcrR family transcriptional regulator [Anaerolineales bacterium]
MTDTRQGSRKPHQERSQRQKRAQRILDAAATLTLRWGYNKTTVDDISREAGVAKGTIYLHWKTRDELFEALIRRERLEVFKDIQRRVTTDPEGWTLRGIVKHTALATMKRPLIKALFMGNQDIIGKMANSEMSTAAYTERLAGFKAYLELLREHGLVRTDLSLQDQVHVWSAAVAGFFFAEPLMPEEFSLSDETMADLMAEMVHRTLETDHPISPEEYEGFSQALTQYMQQSLANAETQDSNELGASLGG